MCGRFTLFKTGELANRFKIKGKQIKIAVSYNVAPNQMFPIIVRNSPNKIRMMRWGFVPEWKKELKPGFINIRSESTTEKSYFKKILLTKRCIIPANGFFEWGRANLEGKEEKYPFYFTLKGQDIFSMAGIYSIIEDAEKVVHYSFAILTCSPNTKVGSIHNRMPVIIDVDNESDWLNPQNSNFNSLQEMLAPYPAEKMQYYPVSRDVNNPENNSPKNIRRLKVQIKR